MSKVIGIRFPDDERGDIERIAKQNNMTITDAVRICLEGVSQGHYEIVNKELVPTAEYLEAIRPNVAIEIPAEETLEYEELGFGSVLRKLREKKYPDRVIKSMMSDFLIQINDGGNYNARRSNDWGA